MTEVADQLRIVRLEKCYGLRFGAGPTRARILELFGTDTVPLPFTLEEDPDRVASELLSMALVGSINDLDLREVCP